jgi:uncharacterized protein
MSKDVLKKVVSDFSTLSQGEYRFLWHGGEPMLAGVDFFEEAVKIQGDYFSSDQRVTNLIQTNATLVDDKWTAFLRKNSFRVGVSVDGPIAIHDKYRRYPSGEGTFGSVMDSLSALRFAGVSVGIIVAITKASVLEARELYSFFVNQGWFRFNVSPVADMDEHGLFRSYSITPREWGLFLVNLFEEWMRQDNKRVHIQVLDEILKVCLGKRPNLCVLSRECGKFLSVDVDGDVYVCGRFLGNPRLMCGNALLQPLSQLRESSEYGQIITTMTTLDNVCDVCEWKNICNGGCATYRFMHGTNSHHPYFCQAMKMFLPYVKDVLTRYGMIESTVWREND